MPRSKTAPLKPPPPPSPSLCAVPVLTRSWSIRLEKTKTGWIIAAFSLMHFLRFGTLFMTVVH